MSEEIQQIQGGEIPQHSGTYQVGFKCPPLETRFQPGNRANPGGAKKGTPRFDLIYADLLKLSPAERAAYQPKNGAEEIALATIKRAIDGDEKHAIRYTEHLADRTDGPVVKRVENVGNVAENSENGLLAKALELIARLIETRGITREEAIALLTSRAPTLGAIVEAEGRVVE